MRVGSLSNCFLSGGDSENGVVVACEQAIWLADVLGVRSDPAVYDVGKQRERESVRTRPRLGVEDETHTAEELSGK